jgi:sulfite exporter TauE/SafE
MSLISQGLISSLSLAMLAGASAGLGSIPHCTLMCGPLAAYACREGGGGRNRQLLYQAGRWLSYALLGALAGGFGGAASGRLPSPWAGALLSWTLALGLAAVAFRLWQRPKASYVPIEIRKQPNTYESRLGRSLRALADRPFLLGFATAMLPCGALLAAVLIAASTGTSIAGASSMLAFALVSGLGLLGASWLARRASRAQHPFAARMLAVAMGVGAVLFVIRPISALQHGEPSCHDSAAHSGHGESP